VKKTSVESKAGRTLATSEDSDTKAAAASVLAQVGTDETNTSEEVASSAGRTLRDAEATDRARSAAGSALSQRDPDDDGDDDEPADADRE